MKIYTKDPGKKKRVFAGEVEGNIFFKIIDPTQHYMRKYGSYSGIQEDVFDQLKTLRVSYIEYRLPGATYQSTPDDWWNYGILTNEGNGSQLFLPIERTDDKGNKCWKDITNG